MFKEYVSTLQEYESTPPEYPSLFEPFTLDWLEENESISLKFLHGAYERDKKENFAVSTEMSLFSCSVVDIFTQMNQRNTSLDKFYRCESKFSENFITIRKN